MEWNIVKDEYQGKLAYELEFGIYRIYTEQAHCDIDTWWWVLSIKESCTELHEGNGISELDAKTNAISAMIKEIHKNDYCIKCGTYIND